MPGAEHCNRKRRTLHLSAPRSPFSPATGLTLPDAPQAASCRDRMLVTAFRSPAAAAPFEATIPGSTFPACYFASEPPVLAARSASPLRYRSRFAPVPAASSRRARCCLCGWLDCLLVQPRLPFGTVTSLRIKASTGNADNRPAFRIRPISLCSPQPCYR